MDYINSILKAEVVTLQTESPIIINSSVFGTETDEYDILFTNLECAIRDV